MYEIKVNGVWLDAEDFCGALLAAATVSAEEASHRGIPANTIRREILIVKDGLYDGGATQCARDGVTCKSLREE